MTSLTCFTPKYGFISILIRKCINSYEFLNYYKTVMYVKYASSSNIFIPEFLLIF